MRAVFIDQLSVLDQAVQLQDAPLDHRLLVLGVLVFGVVLRTRELLRLADLVGDLLAADRLQVA